MYPIQDFVKIACKIVALDSDSVVYYLTVLTLHTHFDIVSGALVVRVACYR